MSRGMQLIFLLLVVVTVLHVLRVSFDDEAPACAEVRAWVLDERTGRCLVRLKRAFGSMEVIVSGNSVDEMQARAQCTMRRWAPAIESACFTR